MKTKHPAPYSIGLSLAIFSSLVLLLALSASVLAGFNATAPIPVRRIFTQIAFAENRLITYHVLEPGPVGVEAFPVDRLRQCPGRARSGWRCGSD
jgi:hypothetical protein